MENVSLETKIFDAQERINTAIQQLNEMEPKINQDLIDYLESIQQIFNEYNDINTKNIRETTYNIENLEDYLDKLKLIELSVKSILKRHKLKRIESMIHLVWKLSVNKDNCIRIAAMPKVLFYISNFDMDLYPIQLQNAIIGLLYNISLTESGLKRLSSISFMTDKLSVLKDINSDAKALLRKIQNYK